MASVGFDTPKSSMTARVSYDIEHGVLSLRLKDGGTHHFAKFPVEKYHELQDLNASGGSVGKFYHAHIKGKFEAAK